MQRSLRSFLIALPACTGLLCATVACFSEHRTVTESSADGVCQIPHTPDVDGSTIVVISAYAFHPVEVRLRQGERVTWLNCEPASGPSHTSSADGSSWRSGLIAPGVTFTRTFNTAGRFEYHCEPHPFMKATVIVD